MCLCTFREALSSGLCGAEPVHAWERSGGVCTHGREQWGPVRGAGGHMDGGVCSAFGERAGPLPLLPEARPLTQRGAQGCLKAPRGVGGPGPSAASEQGRAVGIRIGTWSEVAGGTEHEWGWGSQAGAPPRMFPHVWPSMDRNPKPQELPTAVRVMRVHTAGTSDASGCKCPFLLTDSQPAPFWWLSSPGVGARAAVLRAGGGRAGRRESRGGCGPELGAAPPAWLWVPQQPWGPRMSYLPGIGHCESQRWGRGGAGGWQGGPSRWPRATTLPQ